MVQYSPARLSDSFAALSDATRRGVLERLGRSDASITMRAGALNVRATTSSRSDFRSTVVRFFMDVSSLPLLASIDLLLPFQFLDNLVQLVEA